MRYDNESTLAGPFGSAFRLDLTRALHAQETVCSWVITAPRWHPLWSQYNLAVVRLRSGVPGFPEPMLRFPGATHEVLVVAVNPDYTLTQQEIEDLNWTVPHLEPVNISEQFEATDAQMEQLAGLLVVAVLHGVICPETADAPTKIREAWLSTMVRTLAHMRGEEHAP